MALLLFIYIHETLFIMLILFIYYGHVSHLYISLSPDELEVETEDKLLLVGCENRTLQGWGLQSRQRVIIVTKTIQSSHYP